MLTKLALAFVLGTAACAPVATEVAVATPAVHDPWVAPGVQLVGGWDDPVFWADNGYWWWGGNGWMTWGAGGWMWAQPPFVLATGVREPWRFRGWGNGAIVRDHRWNRGAWRSTGGRWTQPVNRGMRGSFHGGSWTRGSTWGTRGGGGGAVIRNHRR